MNNTRADLWPGILFSSFCSLWSAAVGNCYLWDVTIPRHWPLSGVRSARKGLSDGAARGVPSQGLWTDEGMWVSSSSFGDKAWEGGRSLELTACSPAIPDPQHVKVTVGFSYETKKVGNDEGYYCLKNLKEVDKSPKAGYSHDPNAKQAEFQSFSRPSGDTSRQCFQNMFL